MCATSCPPLPNASISVVGISPGNPFSEKPLTKEGKQGAQDVRAGCAGLGLRQGGVQRLARAGGS